MTGHRSWHRARPLVLVAVLGGVCALATCVPALAETYGTEWIIQIGTNGSPARGFIAVSDTGDASSADCNYTVGYPFGCVVGSGVTASGTGNAYGGLAVSGTGNATAIGMGYGTPTTAASGTGCATAMPSDATNRVVVSGAGCATAPWASIYQGYSTTVAAGDSVGNLAVSSGGLAHSHGASYTCLPAGGCHMVPGAAIAGLGPSSGSGTVAVAGGDATTTGGLATVSLTGDARGGSVTNFALLGEGG